MCEIRAGPEKIREQVREVLIDLEVPELAE